MFYTYVDGACRPNPGKGAYGFVLKNKNREIIHQENGLVGNHVTNNIAEYTAVTKALESAISFGIQNLTVYSDSELVVRQLTEIYQVKDMNLKKMYKKVLSLQKHFNILYFEHIPRENNKEADALAEEPLSVCNTRRKRAEELAENAFIKTDEGYAFIKKGDFYLVDPVNITCSCLDHQNRGGLCKHIMAAQIIDERLDALCSLPGFPQQSKKSETVTA